MIDKYLKKYLPKDDSILSQAMRYSVLAPGKRFRPTLCLEAAKLFNCNINHVLPAACAIEMIHTFTLIHDDLPAMDNSDLRRGKPTCHKKYGEDIAILAGDALSALAFYVIAKYLKPAKSARVVSELSDALLKVVKGQVIDLGSVGRKIGFAKLKEMHLLKTSALIEASLRIGAVLANACDKEINALGNFGRHLGLAFQITDDILDATQESCVLGKPKGLDARNKKSTYVSVLDVEKSRELAEYYRDAAIKELKIFGRKAKTLISIAELAVERRF